MPFNQILSKPDSPIINPLDNVGDAVLGVFMVHNDDLFDYKAFEKQFKEDWEMSFRVDDRFVDGAISLIKDAYNGYPLDIYAKIVEIEGESFSIVEEPGSCPGTNCRTNRMPGLRLSAENKKIAAGYLHAVYFASVGPIPTAMTRQMMLLRMMMTLAKLCPSAQFALDNTLYTAKTLRKLIPALKTNAEYFQVISATEHIRRAIGPTTRFLVGESIVRAKHYQEMRAMGFAKLPTEEEDFRAISDIITGKTEHWSPTYPDIHLEAIVESPSEGRAVFTAEEFIDRLSDEWGISAVPVKKRQRKDHFVLSTDGIDFGISINHESGKTEESCCACELSCTFANCVQHTCHHFISVEVPGGPNAQRLLTRLRYFFRMVSTLSSFYEAKTAMVYLNGNAFLASDFRQHAHFEAKKTGYPLSCMIDMIGETDPESGASLIRTRGLNSFQTREIEIFSENLPLSDLEVKLRLLTGMILNRDIPPMGLLESLELTIHEGEATVTSDQLCELLQSELGIPIRFNTKESASPLQMN